MDGGAYVNSIDAVRDFRAALVTFAHEAKEALASHDLELRRSLAWLLDEQPKYWEKEQRRLDDAVTQARIELERRLNTRLPGGETPSCMEERKMLERARARHRRADEVAAAMRRYAMAAEREAEEYSGRARQLSDVLEADLPRAIAMVDRVLDSLDAYVAVGGTSAKQATSAAMPSAARTDALPEATPPAEAAPKPSEPDRHDTPEAAP
jgi:hypothetical protein